jgi:hypothetical protein
MPAFVTSKKSKSPHPTSFLSVSPLHLWRGAGGEAKVVFFRSRYCSHCTGGNDQIKAANKGPLAKQEYFELIYIEGLRPNQNFFKNLKDLD